ncbi:hypothetical protein DTL42_04165 [Bremerella cremea]|uniref:Uncharacterized protein n=1 Tax=Bremerella cremea TaxID=1031537 RepID=A0A368KVB5_9BACT|nr:hypothetical protein [Bremerella cremea]RCS54348.1 hypothetical protein DTL42_04165 [Bremerella cremea]
MPSPRSNRPLKLDDLKKPDLAAGNNPFKDDLVEEGAEADVHAPADYRGAYEPKVNSNGPLLVTMALIGFLASALPIMRFFWPFVGSVLGIFGWIISLLIAPVTLTYAVADQKAIRLGKFTEQGAWLTNTAFWIALLAIVNAFVTVVSIFYFAAA